MHSDVMISRAGFATLGGFMYVDAVVANICFRFTKERPTVIVRKDLKINSSDLMNTLTPTLIEKTGLKLRLVD